MVEKFISDSDLEHEVSPPAISASVKAGDGVWHEFLRLDTVGISTEHSDGFNWTEEKLQKLFILYSKEKNLAVYETLFRGYFLKENKEKICDFFTNDCRLIYCGTDQEYQDRSVEQIYVGDDKLVVFSYTGESNVSITLTTHNSDFVKSAEDFMKDALTKRTRDNMGKAHVLSQSYDGLVTRELGVVSVPLSLDNYSTSLRPHIQEVLADLKSPLPSGKLTIVEGEPGTGKTFLIRSLISELPNAFFVVVPPSLVDRLGDPSIIPVLLRLKSNDDSVSDEDLLSDARKEKASNPIILIVEDADDCLVKRNGANMPAISTILNLTSGILGDLLDIRIIATTNAKMEEFDDALTRHGRMSYHLQVGKLTHEEACETYKRILKDPAAQFVNPKEDESDVLLATVYKEAKRRGYRGDVEDKAPVRSNAEIKKRNKVGF